MLDACACILQVTERLAVADVVADEREARALQHAFIILGEASKRVSALTRHDHPEIAWGDIAGMRDVLVHAYHRVSLVLLWETAMRDVPALHAALKSLLPTSGA